MLNKKLLLRMNLQLFAEPTPAEPDGNSGTNPVDPADPMDPAKPDDPTDLDPDDSKDVDKIVEKLQKRLDSKTKETSETKSQLEQALARIAELENAGKKGVKELSDEEKAAKAQQEKDEEISRLKSQIKIAESTQQADEVLKDAGLVVGKDMLSMLVDTDDRLTLANVKALINYTNEQQKQWEVKRNTGTTPKQVPKGKVTIDQQAFDAMTFAEKSQLATNDPEQFKKLTGGY